MINTRLQKQVLSIPIFAAASQDDTTAIAAATIKFMSNSSHSTSRLVLYTKKKSIPDFPAEKLELINIVIPAQKILSASHTAIVLPPEDPHYGIGGGYSNCVHYYPNDMEKYNTCMSKPTEVLQGEITEENLKVGIIRRLMYNPNFAALKESLKRFIESQRETARD